jgi:hypothetical protein
MDIHMAKEVIRIIRTERDKKLKSVKTEEDHYYYYGIEEPFINEFCLMLLVAIRHEIERELTLFIAYKTSAGSEYKKFMAGKTSLERGHEENEFRLWLKEERKRLDGLTKDKKKGWKAFYSEVGLDAETIEWLEILRELSNSYKHDIWTYKKNFLEKLGLPTEKLYMTLSESPAIREKLAESVGLASDADYCLIAEAFVNRASDLLSKFKIKFWPFIWSFDQELPQ